MANWIIIRPKWDEVTEYSFNWAQEIVDLLKERGLLVADLGGREVSRSEVEKVINDNPKAYVGFWDHGNEDCLWGGEKEKVIDLDNCDHLANKEVFTMACLSAKELGPEVWRRGGTYYGYVDVFSFTMDALPSFQEAANCGFHYRFIEGDSRQNTLNRAKETFSRLASELMEAGKTFAAICMSENGDNLVYYNAQKPEEKEGCLISLLRLPIRAFFHS